MARERETLCAEAECSVLRCVGKVGSACLLIVLVPSRVSQTQTRSFPISRKYSTKITFINIENRTTYHHGKVSIIVIVCDM